LLAFSAGAADTNLFATRTEQAFKEAQEQLHKQPTNVTALLGFANAAFDWAEFARNDDRRAEIAERGIEASRHAVEITPTNGAPHYWLGMNLGQMARTKTLGALKLVREMETEFLRARELDEHTDYGGPDRCLGYLYRDAPGWPASIGNKKKALEHFERAAQLHPEYPENQLALLESFQNWSEKKNFDRQLKLTEKALLDARQKLTGPQWDRNWAGWQHWLADMKSKDAK
jgi:tetratricopeptide (TPR) repeat protein